MPISPLFFDFKSCKLVWAAALCYLWESPVFTVRLAFWERLKAGGEGNDRGRDGWLASLTWWTWVWANSGSWWWTGMPGVLQSMGSQRVGYSWVTELNWLVIRSDWQWGWAAYQIIFLNTTSVFCLFILTWRNLFDLRFGGERLYCKDSTGGPGWAPDPLLRDWGDLDGNGVLFHHQDDMGGGQGVKVSTAAHQALRCVACMCMLSHVQFWNLMDSSLPGSPVHGISQARILEWVAISSSRGSSRPRDQTCISSTGRQILYHLSHLTFRCVKGMLYIPSFSSYNNPVSRDYFLHSRVEGVLLPFRQEETEVQRGFIIS